MSKGFDEIIAKVGECGMKKVAVSVAQDEAVLEAVKEAKKRGIADAILVGDEAKIREIAASIDMDLSGFEIIDEPDMIQASLKAVKLAHDGKADMYMKGLIDSKNFLRSVLDKEVGLRTGGVLSHVCVFEVPTIDRLLFLTDVAFMTYPTLEDKVNIIKNTLPVAKARGVECPKVAPLAAVEVVNPKMPVTVEAAELVKMNESGEISGCIVDGPLSLDLAIDPEAAKHKGATDRKIQGDADILLFPDIHAGNLVYKAMVHMVEVKNGCILTGTKVPVILTSRSDTFETKVNSMALAAVVAEEMKKEKQMSIKSLIINPGSTSTKIGVFEDETLLFEETLRHSTEEISQYATIVDQKDFRKKIITDLLSEKQFDMKSLNVVVGRGGMLKPIPGGTYAVTDELLQDLKVGVQGQHASNLGGILAREIGDELGVPSYIVDPVVVDELQKVARYSGVPELPRTSVFHALNQKAVAKRYAKETGKAYESLRLIVVHMGGGVSVGAHVGGRIVDVFNALDGDGAFSPERAGAVPNGALVKMCFSGKYTEKEVYSKLVGKGGFNAYLGTNDMRTVTKMANEGDAHAAEVKEAFIYQVAKDIGSMACVLEGKVDQIIVTGGIAYGAEVIESLKSKAGFIAPFTVYPGEDELLALAQGALRVMNGEEKEMVY